MAALGLFLFSIRLLGSATEALSPLLARYLQLAVVGDVSALGAGWLATYATTNGSVVAALSLSLFNADLVTRPQLFLMVAGSRLGAAAFLVIVGVLDYLHRPGQSLVDVNRMGILSFLLTHSIYLPVTVLGYALLRVTDLRIPGARGLEVVEFGWALPLPPVAARLTALLGPLATFLLGLFLLFAGLTLFNRALRELGTEGLRRRYLGGLRNTGVSFALGLVVTGLTFSISFSVGVVVPLYNRGYIERREIIPYVLGANVGTLVDTLIVALVLESGAGVATVLVLVLTAVLVTFVALVFHDEYCRLVDLAQDRLVDDPRALAAFLALLVLVPVALLLGPLMV